MLSWRAVQVTLNVRLVFAAPAGVLTRIEPVVACRGTIAVIRPYDVTLNDARTPWKVTLVAPVNAVPVIVTDVPGRPERGENPLMPGLTANLEALVAAAPALLATVIRLERARYGAVVMISVSDTMVNLATVPPNFIDDAQVKPEPVNVTLEPTRPDPGVNDVRVIGIG